MNLNKPVITIEDVLKLMLNLTLFPYATICRHLVSCDLLNLLEIRGVVLPKELYESVADGSLGDEKVEEILRNLLENKNEL